MKGRYFWLLGLMLWLGLKPVHGQEVSPIEVFAEHNRIDQTLTFFFVNPVSGLSTPVTLTGFDQTQQLLEQVTLTPTGILMKNPSDGRVILVQADTSIISHPFIPQQNQDLVVVDWVLSPDKQSIVWVEVFPAADAWISALYVADIDGTVITPLPTPPQTTVAPFRRVSPLAVTNDRSRIFIDIAAPIETRLLTDYFTDAADIQVYLSERNTYQALPEEPRCDCGAGIGGQGDVFLRLVTLPTEGFELQQWDLQTNTQQVFPVLYPAFGQGGDFWVGKRFALYTFAQNLTTDTLDAQFGLVQADLMTGTQEWLLPPSAQRFQVLGETQDGVLLGDFYSGGTYKMGWETRQLQLVSERTWLGILQEQ